LFIIYVNDLITAIEETNTGVRASEQDLALRLACLMFVDDIETFTHTGEGLKQQFAAAINFARTHHSVINITKSTMTSSEGSTVLKNIIAQTGIRLSVLGTTKQLGTSVKAKEITHQDSERASTDVATRCGTTASMIGTMTRRGMQAGDMAIQDMTEIITTIVLPTLTFGLASTDMNPVDKQKMRQTMGIATHAALGISTAQDPSNTWAALEMGITDPVDHTKITDLTTVICMMEGNANTLATDIVMADSDLQKATMNTKRKWKLDTGVLVRSHKKARHSILTLKARAHRIDKTNGTFFWPEGTPVWKDSSLQDKHIALLVQFRSMKAQGLLKTPMHCTLCNTKNIPHTPIQHYLSHCSHGAEIANNAEKRLSLSPRDITEWATLNENQISILCANPHKRESLLALALETLEHCQLFEPQP
jgi:hypothetical protein